MEDSNSTYILELDQDTQDQALPCLVAAYTILTFKSFFVDMYTVMMPRGDICCNPEGSAGSLAVTANITLSVAYLTSMALMAAVYNRGDAGFDAQKAYNYYSVRRGHFDMPNKSMTKGAGFAAALYGSCFIYMLIATALTTDYTPRRQRVEATTNTGNPLLSNEQRNYRTNSNASIALSVQSVIDEDDPAPCFRSNYSNELKEFIRTHGASHTLVQIPGETEPKPLLEFESNGQTADFDYESITLVEATLAPGQP